LGFAYGASLLPTNSSNTELVLEPALTLLKISKVLTELSVDYFLVGSFASGIRGEFRATNDIDLVSKIEVKDSSRFVALASEDFYCDEIAVPKAIKERSSFNLIDKETFVKVDFFTKLSKLEIDQFPKATPSLIPGTETKINVSTGEYNIIAKLRWFQMSNAQLERQLRDVDSMIAINKSSLNTAYLKKWALALGLEALLTERFK